MAVANRWNAGSTSPFFPMRRSVVTPATLRNRGKVFANFVTANGIPVRNLERTEMRLLDLDLVLRSVRYLDVGGIDGVDRRPDEADIPPRPVGRDRTNVLE